MSTFDPPADAICPHCGTRLRAGSAECWLCAQAIVGKFREPQVDSPKPSNEPGLGRGEMTFGLSSLMLVITLVAVCLGVFQIAPGLGILLAIVATPALIRTMLYSRRRRAQGEALTIGDKVLAMLGSVGVVVSIVSASVIAFFGVCFGTALTLAEIKPVGAQNSLDMLISLSVGGGVVVALAVGGLLSWKLWPRLK